METVQSSVENLVSYIQNTKEYQMCMSIKEKMRDNTEIQELVKRIKTTQKKYIRSGYDDQIQKELDSYRDQLYSIPIYSTYLENLEKVNEMIEYVKDRLNDYFTNLYQ